jgi:hypothetical protein
LLQVRWCPGVGCGRAIEHLGGGGGGAGGGGDDAACAAPEGGCGAVFCWACGAEAHRPLSCATVRAWLLKNSAESENMNWILAHTKPWRVACASTKPRAHRWLAHALTHAASLSLSPCVRAQPQVRAAHREEHGLHAHDLPGAMQVRVLLAGASHALSLLCMWWPHCRLPGACLMLFCSFPLAQCTGAWKDHGERTGGFYACNRYETARAAGEINETVRALT